VSWYPEAGDKASFYADWWVQVTKEQASTQKQDAVWLAGIESKPEAACPKSNQLHCHLSTFML